MCPPCFPSFLPLRETHTPSQRLPWASCCTGQALHVSGVDSSLRLTSVSSVSVSQQYQQSPSTRGPLTSGGRTCSAPASRTLRPPVCAPLALASPRYLCLSLARPVPTLGSLRFEPAKFAISHPKRKKYSPGFYPCRTRYPDEIGRVPTFRLGARCFFSAKNSCFSKLSDPNTSFGMGLASYRDLFVLDRKPYSHAVRLPLPSYLLRLNLFLTLLGRLDATILISFSFARDLSPFFFPLPCVCDSRITCSLVIITDERKHVPDGADLRPRHAREMLLPSTKNKVLAAVIPSAFQTHAFRFRVSQPLDTRTVHPQPASRNPVISIQPSPAQLSSAKPSRPNTLPGEQPATRVGLGVGSRVARVDWCPCWWR